MNENASGNRRGSVEGVIQRCGLCSLISSLLRRAMCVGSRRGSGESYYQELANTAVSLRRDVEVLLLWVFIFAFILRAAPVRPPAGTENLLELKRKFCNQAQRSTNKLQAWKARKTTQLFILETSKIKMGSRCGRIFLSRVSSPLHSFVKINLRCEIDLKARWKLLNGRDIQSFIATSWCQGWEIIFLFERKRKIWEVIGTNENLPIKKIC